MPKKLTTQQFIERSIKAHGRRYNYSLAEYINNLAAITIVCPDHGSFSQRPAHHMDGHGCPRCKASATSDRCRGVTEDFVSKATAVHGDLYDYSKAEYVRSSVKVEIVCRIHGVFRQTPNAHLSGSGCPKCAGKFLSTDEFIAKARSVHGDRFSYDSTEYRTIKGSWPLPARPMVCSTSRPKAT